MSSRKIGFGWKHEQAMSLGSDSRFKFCYFQTEIITGVIISQHYNIKVVYWKIRMKCDWSFHLKPVH